MKSEQFLARRFMNHTEYSANVSKSIVCISFRGFDEGIKSFNYTQKVSNKTDLIRLCFIWTESAVSETTGNKIREVYSINFKEHFTGVQMQLVRLKCFLSKDME
jgi:hypothetical protein